MRNECSFCEQYSKAIWLGVNDVDKEGIFVDNEGNPIKFDMWNSGEPNDLNGEDAAHIIHANSGWVNSIGGYHIRL